MFVCRFRETCSLRLGAHQPTTHHAKVKHNCGKIQVRLNRVLHKLWGMQYKKLRAKSGIERLDYFFDMCF